MQTKTRIHRNRGAALVTAMLVIMMVLITGSGVLSLSMQAARRGKYDALRMRAIALAEGGAEKALHYLRTTAPDGTTLGEWRTNGLTETVANQGSYTISITDGIGPNVGKVIVQSTGHAQDGSLHAWRAIRVTAVLDREDISVWNNVIFGGVGQAGKSVNGNVRIRGSVHLLGDGEEYTDSDGDGHWDNAETFTDKNGNGIYNLGEPYTDTDGDGHRDAKEPFDDVNGSGIRDPALTVTDMSSEISGSADVGNSYNGMPSNLRNLLPPIPTKSYGGETVQSLSAKMRVKHGRVDISGSATVGFPNATGGSPLEKETLDATFVSDGFGGNKGSASVYSDNGYQKTYNLGNMVKFPTLTEPAIVDGVSYPSYMAYLKANALVITGDVTFKPGTTYSQSGPKGSISVDSAGKVTINGMVYFTGNVNFDKNGGNKSMTYSGRGTIITEQNLSLETDLLPTSATFPITHAIGFIARKDMSVGTSSQLSVTGAFYAQQRITSSKQNELGGTFVSSYYAMSNVPHMYQVPALVDNLPPGMPGNKKVYVKSLRLDSWREIPAVH